MKIDEDTRSMARIAFHSMRMDEKLPHGIIFKIALIVCKFKHWEFALVANETLDNPSEDYDALEATYERMAEIDHQEDEYGPEEDPDEEALIWINVAKVLSVLMDETGPFYACVFDKDGATRDPERTQAYFNKRKEHAAEWSRKVKAEMKAGMKYHPSPDVI